jgi:hypothetical protein
MRWQCPNESGFVGSDPRLADRFNTQNDANAG